MIERIHHAIGEHQQRRLVDVRNQEQQEILMTELAEQSRLAIGEERVAGIAHHHEGVTARHEPRTRASFALLVPELVVAVAVLEVPHVARRIRQRFRISRARHETQPHEIGACQRSRVVHRNIGEQRHPAVLDLPVADQPLFAGIVGNERTQKISPVVCKARRTIATDEREIALALLEI